MASINQLGIHRMLLSSSCRVFTCKMFEYINKAPYILGEHHKMICDALDKVVRGDIRKLIINIAPRYGKTILVSQYFIAYGLALNPEAKFLHLSYSGSLTEENSLSIKDILNSEYFQAVYPTRIKSGTRSKWFTNKGGGVYATSTLGQITGFGAGRLDSEQDEKAIDEFTATFNPDRFSGAIVIDVPLKPDDALSDTVRESVNRRFETTIRNRVNSRKTPIVVIMQRLHEHDLCGYLEETEPNEWHVLSIPCIQYKDGEERALWEFKHTLDELHELRRINPFVFETQYMQNPKPMEGLMYNKFKTYGVLPFGEDVIRCNYTDTADTGADFLCSICYDEYPDGCYVTDIIYTKKPMEDTEPMMAEMLTKNRTQVCFVESNNGGRGFRRNVESQCRILKNRKTTFIDFSQTNNKQVRIFSQSNDVQNMILFPEDWETRFPEYASAMKSYRKEGRNAHDDAPDATTGIIEMIGKAKRYCNPNLYNDILNDML